MMKYTEFDALIPNFMVPGPNVPHPIENIGIDTRILGGMRGIQVPSGWPALTPGMGLILASNQESEVT